MMDEFTANLATFDDAWTMRHTRLYAHPIERVWQAITDDAQLNRWLLRRVAVDAREGGRCSFTWGGDAEQVGVVRDLDPPRRVVYDLETSFMTFELEEVDEGTQLVFLHRFLPGAHIEPQDFDGGDQPAGTDSPWRPSFSQGFHVMLDALGMLLDDEAPAFENVLEWLGATGQNADEIVDRHVTIYREHIRNSCPNA